MNQPIQIAMVGLGKIARDQHLPVIAADPNFELAFVVDRAARIGSHVPWFSSLEEALMAGIHFDAISICTSPQARQEIVEMLLRYDCAMLLEKPAASSYERAEMITSRAIQKDIRVCTAWHSRFAHQISTAKKWVEANTIIRGSIEWRENVAKWHPGQDWLWRDGGYGVFDPGINALSILTEIAPADWSVLEGSVDIPQNAQTPSRANIRLASNRCVIEANFEFHEHQEDIWSIELVSSSGSTLILSDGGARLVIDNRPVPATSNLGEYEGVYKRFGELVVRNQSDCDLAPLKLVDEILSVAEITRIGPIRF